MNQTQEEFDQKAERLLAAQCERQKRSEADVLREWAADVDKGSLNAPARAFAAEFIKRRQA